MTNTIKRPRGRPRGSSRHQAKDMAILRRAADRLAAAPDLKPTTAIRQVITSEDRAGEMEETLIRRLQGKWKVRGPALLAEARARQAAGPNRRSARRRHGLDVASIVAATASSRRIADEFVRLANPPGLADVLRQHSATFQLAEVLRRADPLAEFRRMAATQDALHEVAERHRAIASAGSRFVETMRVTEQARRNLADMARDFGLPRVAP